MVKGEARCKVCGSAARAACSGGARAVCGQCVVRQRCGGVERQSRTVEREPGANQAPAEEETRHEPFRSAQARAGGRRQRNRRRGSTWRGLKREEERERRVEGRHGIYVCVCV